MRAGAGGFTLVEAVATTAVIAVVAAAVLPLYSGFLKESRLRAAREEAVNALVYARDTAVRTGLPCRVVFDAESDSLLVERLAHVGAVWDTTRTTLTRAEALSRIYRPAIHPLRPDRAYRVHYRSDRRFGGAEIARADFAGSDTLSFDALGHASASGTVTFALGGETAGVRVTAFGDEKGGVSLIEAIQEK